MFVSCFDFIPRRTIFLFKFKFTFRLTSPLILIVLGAVFYACYKIKKINTPVTLFKKELNTNQQCILVNCASVPVLYICGAGAAIFWVLGASVFLYHYMLLFTISMLLLRKTWKAFYQKLFN